MSVISPSNQATLQHPQKEEGQTRDKSQDLSFSFVYLGFLLIFVVFQTEALSKSFPGIKHTIENTHFVAPTSTWFLPVFSFFVVCPILSIWRRIIKSLLISKLAINWAGLKESSLKYNKFCEQGWLAIHYSIATVTGLYVLKDKPWFNFFSEEAQTAISASQEDRETDQIEINLFLLYSLQLGFYSLELVTLFFTKNRRIDAMVYFLHHFFTLFLMSGSWYSYHHRIGTLVLFLHDIGDIFLPIGKLFTYAEEYIRTTKSSKEFEFHKNVGMSFFVLFVITFSIPRLILFGKLIYQGFDKYSWYTCCGVDLSNGFCGPCVMGPGWALVLLTTLGLLYPMHVYWFYLIVKMAIRLLLSPGEYDDVRSDKEE